MDAYIIKMILDKKELIDFIDAGLASKATIVPVQANAPAPIEAAPKRGAPRGPRGSKVHDSIIRRLRSGSSSLKELRGALEADGLAPNSVSTGLALLQKSGQVERIGDGVYALRQAAE